MCISDSPINTADRGNGNVGYARGQYDIDYQAIDITIGSKTPMRFLGGEVTQFYGVRSLDVSQSLQTRYANNTVTDITDMTDESKVDGIGLFVGANTRYRVNPNFAIRAKALGGPAVVSAQASYREVETDNSVTNVDVTLSEDDVALFFEIGVGGEYLIYQRGPVSVLLEGGYEIVGYVGVPGFIDWTGDSGSTRAELSKSDGDFGFDGFYLRATVNF